LGGGSNCLIADKGIRGVVILNRKGTIDQIDPGIVEVTSGTLNNQIVRFLIENELTGLEFLVGIPGTIGAAIRNNGHFRNPESFQHYFVDYRQVKDQFVNDFVEDALVITPQGHLRRVDRVYLQPEYHQSKLKETDDIVVSATFSLGKSDSNLIRKSARDQLLWRKDREIHANGDVQIIMPPDPITGHRVSQPKLPTPGCMFSNTSNADNHPVGRMLDMCGLRGTQVGDVMVAHEHANYIVNLGVGTAADALKLISICRDQVFQRFGVTPRLEIDLLGEFDLDLLEQVGIAHSKR
jgi:UDP-N-acetylmuramate dehydrogenase